MLYVPLRRRMPADDSPHAVPAAACAEERETMRNQDERQTEAYRTARPPQESPSRGARYRLRNPARFFRRAGSLLLLAVAVWLATRAFAASWREPAGEAVPTNATAGLPVRQDESAPTPAATPAPTPDPPPAGTEWRDLLVVIDAGHGGRDPGTVSPDETIYEKNITLDVAKRCAAALEAAGVPVRMTREADVELAPTVKADLRARCGIANEAGATLFVSIHVNSLELTQHGAAGVYGLEAYYQDKENLFAGLTDKLFAQTVGDRVAQATGQPLNAVIRRGLSVLTGTDMPGVLLEIGYLSNAGDRSRMQEAAYCDEVAEGVAHAVLDAVAALRQEDRNGVRQVLRNLPGQPANTYGATPEPTTEPSPDAAGDLPDDPDPVQSPSTSETEDGGAT